MKKNKIITLCGSTRFKEEFFKQYKALTLQGYIVLMPGVFRHAGDDEAKDSLTKKMLDNLHIRKINMSDEVLIINPDGYIGESTKEEIAYCDWINMPVKYLFPNS